MNFEAVKKIADAVLYEGYILYPYRASAVKNRQRFNFGTIYPQIHCELSGGVEPWKMRTECLAVGRWPVVEVRIRFLQMRSREVWRLHEPAGDVPLEVEPAHEVVESLRIGHQTFAAWQESVEREIVWPALDVSSLAVPQHLPFSFAAARDREPLRDLNGQIVGLLVRREHAIRGTLEIAASRVDDQLFKVGISIENHSSLDVAAGRSRDDVVVCSFISTHTVLGVEHGEFVSLLDPPDQWRAVAAECRNVGTWPVLVGEEGSRDMLLSSPIILYDYPLVAPESAGSFFDGTEIDEMLALRVMTLTDEEKQEMRDLDPRAQQILERTETLTPEHLMKLHGAVRALKGSHA